MTGSTQTEFFVNKGETQLGPWTMQELAARVASGEVVVTDFIFDEAQNDWVALFQCAAFQSYMQSQKPTAAPPKRSPAAAQTMSEAQLTGEPTEWYVQKGQHRYGPFTHGGVIRALQEKTVYQFDLCWKSGMPEWVRIAQCSDFSPEKIRELSSHPKSAQGIFTQRQFPRIPFESEVLVHDNRSVWLGRAFEGSAGGSGLVIENATLVPGQTVLLHFAERADLPAFNALCEIVSKKYVADVRDAKSPVSYSVRFVKLDAHAESRVQKYFLNSEAA